MLHKKVVLHREIKRNILIFDNFSFKDTSISFKLGDLGITYKSKSNKAGKNYDSINLTISKLTS